MKKFLSYLLIFCFLASFPAFSQTPVMEYEAISWALCEQLMEKTREAAKESPDGVHEDVFLRIRSIEAALPDAMPENVIFIDMDDLTHTLKENAQDTLADALADIDALSSRILSHIDENTLAKAKEAAGAFYEKAEGVMDIISGEIAAFSDSVTENITDEDLEELQELGEAFTDQLFSIFSDVLEGAGEYAQGLFERLPEDTQSTINEFVKEAGEKLDSVFDEAAYAYVNNALTLRRTLPAEQSGANGFCIFDTGEDIVPAVYVQYESGDAVTMTAMYMDRDMLDMLISIEEAIKK